MVIDHGGGAGTAAAERTECTDSSSAAGCDGIRFEAVEPVHVPESASVYGRQAYEVYCSVVAQQHGAPPRFDDLDECEREAWTVAALQMWQAGHDVAAKVSQAVRTAEGRVMFTAMQTAVGAATHAALDQAYERGGHPATVSQLDPAQPTDHAQEGDQR